ncbi:LamG-like jellyroll fold domain-containing protein [Sphingomonas elodea]|uniref:Putative cell surface protein n=1 Tax=Sphingomonas elodea TaxID=179878 RepID=Q7X2P4_SPHEL|nr:LamG-like jellyroll fold domain-containing protein [Sphingomonas elodea]AAP46173.1 putative cell surface protein [Sphingomonas elodea ATCC 31461]
MPAITVKNQAELDAAIKTAKGGDTILLAPGTYSSVTMTNIKPATVLTIQSLDTKNPAVVQSLWISSSNNITFKDLDVKRDYRPANDWETASRILNSNNITVDNVRFSGGSGDPALSTGVGLSIRSGTNIKFLNSSVDHFGLGLSVQDINKMTVQGSTFRDNRRDHTNFSEMTQVLIDRNNFVGLYPQDGEHPDAIQFMTAGRAKANTGITISNNVIMQGDGLGTQGVFLGEETGNLPYKDVTINNNLIYLSGLYHGINVVNGSNVNITNNSTLSVADERSTWIRVENVTSGSIVNNVADEIIAANSAGVTLSKNVSLVKDSVALRKIPDLHLGAAARVAGLVLPGVGYNPGTSSSGTASTLQPPKLLLDLNFASTGAIDSSIWSSDETVSPLAAGAVSDGMVRVQTGSGVELGRDTSRQLFSLSAFTLNFNLKRDAPNAAVGQIMGVFKSWAINLGANGELTFTMTNAAGKTSTLTTKGAKITDANLHRIALTYDSARGTAAIYVDGVVRGTAAMSGSTRAQEFWGVYLGGQFTNAFSGSLGDIEVRDAALSAAQIVALNANSSVTATGVQAADAVRATVVNGAASTAAALMSGTTVDGATTSLPTLTLLGGSVGAGSVQSPLASAIAKAVNAQTTGSLSKPTSFLSGSWMQMLDAFHA